MMGAFETRMNYMLRSSPAVRHAIKKTYQALFSIGNLGFKSTSNVRTVSPDDGMEYLFGYYDKSPWNADNDRMLCLRVFNAVEAADSSEIAQIGLLRESRPGSFEYLAETNCWNVQQGCMLQWLGPDYKSRIIFNDFRNGDFCSVIFDVDASRELSEINRPVYSVCPDGRTAFSLDFSRLHALRPGYGYSNIPVAKQELEPCPDDSCIWILSLESGLIRPILTYQELAAIEPKPSMDGALHKVNHIMANPLSDSFMVLHRWLRGEAKFTRLIVFNADGSNPRVLLDDDMVSHCCWDGPDSIIAYANTMDEGLGYYRIDVATGRHEKIWDSLQRDGHPSISPRGGLAVTDTYPDRGRVAHVYLISQDQPAEIARVKMPFRYDNEVRCDLHPRWNRDGTEVCIDSAHQGLRGMYVIRLDE